MTFYQKATNKLSLIGLAITASAVVVSFFGSFKVGATGLGIAILGYIITQFGSTPPTTPTAPAV